MLGIMGVHILVCFCVSEQSINPKWPNLLQSVAVDLDRLESVDVGVRLSDVVPTVTSRSLARSLES
jgi:hypothetical protein